MSAPDPTLQPTSAEAFITRDHFDVVAFDLDGVITDTAILHETAWKQLFDAFLDRRVTIGAEAFRSLRTTTGSMSTVAHAATASGPFLRHAR